MSENATDHYMRLRAGKEGSLPSIGFQGLFADRHERWTAMSAIQ